MTHSHEAAPSPAPPVAAPAPQPSTHERVLQIGVALAAYLLVNTSAQLLATTLSRLEAPFAATPEGTSWIATTYTAGVFVGVVAAAPLLRAFGLRRYALGCTIGYATFAAVCAAAPDLSQLLALRAVQGMAAGGLGPAAFAAVFSLSGRPRLMGALALLAFVLLLPGALGPALAGPVEAGFGWRGLFWAQILGGVVAAMAVAVGLPKGPVAPHALRTDWTGIALLGAGLAGLTVVLSQGASRSWTESNLIVTASGATLIALSGFALAHRRRPGAVIDLKLLARLRFIWPVTLNFVFRTGLAVSVYLAPQYLIIVHGDAPLDLSGVFAWSVTGQILALPLVWWLIHRMDARPVIVAGLVLCGSAGLMLSQLAGEAAAAGSFRLPLALLGAAQVMFLVPNLQAGSEVLTPPDGPTATLAFNVTSIGGLTLGAGLAAQLVGDRHRAHAQDLPEQLWTVEAGGLEERQAWLLAFQDSFLAFGFVLFAAAAGALLLAPLPALVRGQRPAPAPAPAS